MIGAKHSYIVVYLSTSNEVLIELSIFTFSSLSSWRSESINRQVSASLKCTKSRDILITFSVTWSSSAYWTKMFSFRMIQPLHIKMKYLRSTFLSYLRLLLICHIWNLCWNSRHIFLFLGKFSNETTRLLDNKIFAITRLSFIFSFAFLYHNLFQIYNCFRLWIGFLLFFNRRFRFLLIFLTNLSKYNKLKKFFLMMMADELYGALAHLIENCEVFDVNIPCYLSSRAGLLFDLLPRDGDLHVILLCWLHGLFGRSKWDQILLIMQLESEGVWWSS